MSRTARLAALVLSLVMLALGIVGASTQPAIPKLETPVTVKVGFAKGSMSVAGVYVAIAKGYFREAGITNEFVPLASFNAILPAVATGELDLGSGGPSVALFNALERGVRMKIVADQNTAFPGQASIGLMVRKDLIDGGQIKTYADLKGRTFALSARKASLELDLLKVLKMGGLTLDDIKLVTMPFPQMNVALASRAIDACFQLEPLVTDAVTKNIAVRWRGHDEVTPNRQNGFVVFSEAFAKRTDVARAWTVAYVRGLRDYNDAVRNRRGREEIYQILMENTSVKDRAVYDRMVLPGMHPDGELNVASIREALSDFRASGDVKADIDLDQVVDLSFIRYARQVLGPYPR